MARRSSKREVPTWEEEIGERDAKLAREARTSLPEGLIENLDHYNAGSEKDPKRPKRSIEEILELRSQRVPSKEWANLPKDLIDRLDHYTSGAGI